MIRQQARSTPRVTDLPEALRPLFVRPDMSLSLDAPATRRVQSEFREMPGLRLTLAQAARLFGLSQDACGRILSDLVADDLLHLAADGRYDVRQVSL
jgi:hypothetical protein